MLFAKVLVPLTVKLEVPVLLVMVLPLAMTKLLMVKLFCRSKMPVLLIVKLAVLAPKVPLPKRVKVPPLMVVVPV